jgi:hypothetical protein
VAVHDRLGIVDRQALGDLRRVGVTGSEESSRRTVAGMSMTWTLHHHGWAVCTVADQNAQAQAVASCVTGGPEYLLSAVANIVLGASQTDAEFEAEPTVYRWIFQRRGLSVDIRLLEVPSRGMPDEAGTTKWTSHQPIDDLARATIRAFDAVVDEHRQDGYQATWGRPFPTTELHALRTAWRNAKRHPYPPDRSETADR